MSTSVRTPTSSSSIAGHVDETVDDVVSVAAGYTIIRKKAGDPRAVAVETDPRSP